MANRVLLMDDFVSDLSGNKTIYLFAGRYGSNQYDIGEYNNNYKSDTLTTMSYIPTRVNEDDSITICILSDNIDNYHHIYLMYNTKTHELSGSTSDEDWKIAAILSLSDYNVISYATNYITIDLSQFYISSDLLTTRSTTEALYNNVTSSVFVGEHEHETNEDNSASNLPNTSYFIEKLRDYDNNSITVNGNPISDSLLISDSGDIISVDSSGNKTVINSIPSDISSLVASNNFISNQLSYNLEDLYTVGDFKIRLLGKSLDPVSSPTIGELNSLVTDVPSDPSARQLKYINLPSNFHYYGMTTTETSFNNITAPGTYKLNNTQLSEGPILLDNNKYYNYFGILEVNANSESTGISIIQKLYTNNNIYYRLGSGSSTIIYSQWVTDIHSNNIKDYGIYKIIISNQSDFNNFINNLNSITEPSSVAIIASELIANTMISLPNSIVAIDGYNGATINFSSSSGLVVSNPAINKCSISNITINLPSISSINSYGLSGFTNVLNCNINSVSSVNGFTAYNNCTNLNGCSVNLSLATTSINGYSFYNCSYLSNCRTNQVLSASPYFGSKYIDSFSCTAGGTHYVADADRLGGILPSGYSKNDLQSDTNNIDSLVSSGEYKLTDDTQLLNRVFQGVTDTICFLTVEKSNNIVSQVITLQDGSNQAIRTSNDSGSSWSDWRYILNATYENGMYSIVVSESRKLSSVYTINSDSDIRNLLSNVSKVGDSINVILSGSGTYHPTWYPTQATINSINSGAGTLQKITENSGVSTYQLIIYHGDEMAMKFISSQNNSVSNWYYPITDVSYRPRLKPFITTITNGNFTDTEIQTAAVNSSTANNIKYITIYLQSYLLNSTGKIDFNLTIMSKGVGVIKLLIAGSALGTDWVANSGGSIINYGFHDASNPGVSSIELGTFNGLLGVRIIMKAALSNPAVTCGLSAITDKSDSVILDQNTIATILLSNSTNTNWVTSYQLPVNIGSIAYKVTNEIANSTGAASTDSLFILDANPRSKLSNSVVASNSNESTEYYLLGATTSSSGSVTPVILTKVKYINGQLKPVTVNTQGT